MALNSFSPNTKIESSKVNENFTNLANGTEITNIDSQIITASIGCFVYMSSAQSILDQSVTILTGWTDSTAGRWNSGDFNTTTGVFTCPVAGKYLVNSGATMNNLASSDVQYSYIYLNETIMQRSVNYPSATNLEVTGTINVILDCAVNDEITLRVYHNYGSARDCLGGSFTWLSIGYLGK